MVDPVAVLQELVDAKGSQRAAAKHLQISESYLCDMLKGKRNVSEYIASLLGLEREVTSQVVYRRIKGAA